MKLTDKEKNRYNRHLILDKVGEAGQLKLKQAKVLVVGAGGLGCPVLQYLAAAGVGTIGIIDNDKVDESNLQRQVLYNTEDIGQLKAEVAAKKLAIQNPLININSIVERLTAKNAINIFQEYDIIVDGTDNFATRYLINDASVITEKPLVFGSIYKFEGQVAVFNYKNSPSYRCLFSEAPTPGTVLNCSEIGVLGVLPGLIGMYQANEVVKIILEIGNILNGQVMLLNTLDNSRHIIKVVRNEEEIAKVKERANSFDSFDYDYFCNASNNENNKEISSTDFSEAIKDGILILDVREEYEEPKIEGTNVICIPMAEVTSKVAQLDKQNKMIVCCQNGNRSKAVIEQLEKEYGFTNLVGLKGGISTWDKN